MKLFDSHCHLDDSSYDNDVNDVIKRANTSSIQLIMVVGTTVDSSKKAVSLAKTHSDIFASVGIHPHDATDFSETALDALKKLSRHPKVKAWGETGLDFNRMFSPQKDQEYCFIRQIEAADELGFPIIFHERDSNGRFLEIVKAHHKNKGNGVVHCFSGNRDELFKYLDLGYYIGITGILTIETRGRELRQLAAHIPVERILIETDAPYLTPAPEKNKIRRNEPAFVKSTLIRLAEVRNEDAGELADIIWHNTRRLYNIS